MMASLGEAVSCVMPLHRVARGRDLEMNQAQGWYLPRLLEDLQAGVGEVHGPAASLPDVANETLPPFVQVRKG